MNKFIIFILLMLYLFSFLFGVRSIENSFNYWIGLITSGIVGFIIVEYK